MTKEQILEAITEKQPDIVHWCWLSFMKEPQTTIIEGKRELSTEKLAAFLAKLEESKKCRKEEHAGSQWCANPVPCPIHTK